MAQIFDWRKYLPVHPAADLFTLMPEAERKELAADIDKNGLQTPIVLWTALKRDDFDTHCKRRKAKYEILAKANWQLIDGRNRLDACAQLGRLFDDDGTLLFDGFELEVVHKYGDEDPYALARSLNVHRRHLTPDQKRELAGKFLKANPEASDRQIGSQVKADHKTVAAVRAELEERGEIAHADKRTDTKGREQPAKRKQPDPLTVQKRKEKKAAKKAAVIRKTAEDFARASHEESKADAQTSADVKANANAAGGGDDVDIDAVPAEAKRSLKKAKEAGFDHAIAELKRLSANHSDDFLDCEHSAADIEEVAQFLFHVAHVKAVQKDKAA
jgi:hypothetical protein